LASPVRAQGAAVEVVVDATAAGAPLQRVWPFFGYDEINYTTAPEGKALLAALASANSAPVRVRSHFLFNTGDGTPALKWGSTNVYREDAAGNPVYQWDITDGILDTVTGVGAFPFVELGFMPEALSSHPSPYQNTSPSVLDSGCFYPPTDYSKWASFVREWAAHAKERYPSAESSWLWELWNEPDISYWQGTPAEYAKLYDYTEAALHEVLPNAALGGPAVAIAGGDFLRQFLAHCETGTNAVTGELGTRLDLVTFHAKGGVTLTDGVIELDLGRQLLLHRAGFNAVAAAPKFARTPIYLTEADPEGCAACPASSKPENAYRNSTAYGAYELAMMKHSIELAAERDVNLAGLLTWAFTFPGTPYFAGYRALSTNGIHLPVFGAFKLLGRLGQTRLPLTSSGAIPLRDILSDGVRGQAEIDGMATLDDDVVRVLVWNYHDQLLTSAATPVHLSLTVPRSFAPNVRVSHLRVDETHGDAYTVWVSQGMPENPSPAQLRALQQAMDPAPYVPDVTLAVPADGVLEFDFELPRFGISLLTIQPAKSVVTGGDDAGKTGGCACRVNGRGELSDSAAPLVAILCLALTRGAHRRRAHIAERKQRRSTRLHRKDFA
jgi:xylan 1,4-beta-xylosidase